MADPLNRKEKPVLTPPQGELPQKSTNSLAVAFVLVSLLVLLVLTATVIWLLPSKTSPVVDQNRVVQTTSPDNSNTNPFPKKQESVEAERLLGAWLKARTIAESENIQLWGGDEYRAVLDSAARADTFFRDEEYGSAQTLYRKAIDDLSYLVATREEKLRAAISRGDEYLQQMDSEKALSAYQEALLIDQDNREALYGVNRANNLDHVLALYSNGLHMERKNELEQAHQLLRQAMEKDSDFAPAREALERVDKKLQESSFRAAMSRALTALENKQLAAAERALEEAAQYRPEDPSLAAAWQRSEEMHRVQQLKNLQIRADQLISTEDWAGVVATYRKAMKIDNNVGFATIGLPEAENRLQLDKTIKTILSQPDRLQDKGPLREAQQALMRAQREDNPGKILHAQIQKLSDLVQNASTIVEVVLRSDNATQVEIYHIGRFQPFMEKHISLKPGTYTVVGRRQGYRDIRLSMRIKSEMKMPVFFIRCEEPI